MTNTNTTIITSGVSPAPDQSLPRADAEPTPSPASAVAGLSRAQRAALAAMLTPRPPKTWTDTDDLYAAVFGISRSSRTWRRRRGAEGTRTLHRDGTPFRVLRPVERASLARTMKRLVDRGLAAPWRRPGGGAARGMWTLTDAGRAAALALLRDERRIG